MITNEDWNNLLDKDTFDADTLFGYSVWLRDDKDDQANADALDWIRQNNIKPLLWPYACGGPDGKLVYLHDGGFGSKPRPGETSSQRLVGVFLDSRAGLPNSVFDRLHGEGPFKGDYGRNWKCYFTMRNAFVDLINVWKSLNDKSSLCEDSPCLSSLAIIDALSSQK